MAAATAVAMDRVQTGNGVPPAETDLSFLPCPLTGIKNNATELIGFTPMVRFMSGLPLSSRTLGTCTACDAADAPS